MLACAALEQLCREGAWCRALVQQDVVPLLERLVRSLVITPVGEAGGSRAPARLLVGGRGRGRGRARGTVRVRVRG